MNISNKSVLITGANRGIGRALLDEALRRGAKKVYAGTRGALQHPDERVTPLTLDVTNGSQIQRAVDEVDTLDVLINNAGIAIYDDLSNLDVLEQTFAVNFLGLLKVTNAFLPLLKRSKGAIVNDLSLAGLAPLPIIPSYSASKAAALNLTQSLRALLAGQGVTVHAVVLGPVDTDMNRGFNIPKALTRSRDALAAERRRMPWMAVEKKYEFDGPKGKVSLLDLFEGRRQLIVYRAFFEPGVFGWPEHACRGCSLGADQVAHLAHLNARDTTLAYASRAQQADIARLKARMGWEMPWYTITDSFDVDFGGAGAPDR